MFTFRNNDIDSFVGEDVDKKFRARIVREVLSRLGEVEVSLGRKYFNFCLSGDDDGVSNTIILSDDLMMDHVVNLSEEYSEGFVTNTSRTFLPVLDSLVSCVNFKMALSVEVDRILNGVKFFQRNNLSFSSVSSLSFAGFEDDAYSDFLNLDLSVSFYVGGVE